MEGVERRLDGGGRGRGVSREGVGGGVKEREEKR